MLRGQHSAHPKVDSDCSARSNRGHQATRPNVARIPYVRRCAYNRSARVRCHTDRGCALAHRGLGVRSCGVLNILIAPHVTH